MKEKVSTCLQLPFSCLHFYIKTINNLHLTACLQSKIHLCSNPELLQCCRKALWQAVKGRRERGGGGGARRSGREGHGPSRCEMLMPLMPPSPAIHKSVALQPAWPWALCSASNCTCVGLRILMVSDSPASSGWNSFHQIKQQQQEEEEEEKAAEGRAEQCLPSWKE